MNFLLIFLCILSLFQFGQDFPHLICEAYKSEPISCASFDPTTFCVIIDPNQVLCYNRSLCLLMTTLGIAKTGISFPCVSYCRCSRTCKEKEKPTFSLNQRIQIQMPNQVEYYESIKNELIAQ